MGFWCSAPAVEFLARGYRVRCLSGCPQSGHKEVGALDGHPGRWDSDLMTQAAKKLLEEFDALQEGDRAEVLAELLRRVALAPHDLPDPDDLVSAADQIFLELDGREQSQ